MAEQLDSESVQYTLTRQDIMKAMSAKAGMTTSHRLAIITSDVLSEAIEELYNIASRTNKVGSSVNSFLVDEDVYRLILTLGKFYKPKYVVKFHILYPQVKNVTANSKEEAIELAKASCVTNPYHDLISVEELQETL